MNENVLVKTGLTIATPAIQDVITKLISRVFLRWDMKIELEKLKAGKLGEVLEKLLKDGKMTYLELYRFSNFFDVAKFADEAAKKSDEDINVKNHLDFDWLMRLFDAVGNISNEDLKKLWGQILKNQTTNTKICSLRTLDMIRSMSPEEAQAFTSLCNYVLRSGNSYFIYPTGFYDASEGYSECFDFMYKKRLDYSNSIMPLLEIGVLSANHDLVIYLDTNTKLLIYNEKVLCIVESENEKKFQQEAYFLTKSGLELYNIIKNTPDFVADMEYAVLCFKQMKKDNTDFKFTAHKILEYGDEPHFDSIDLLTERKSVGAVSMPVSI